MPTCDGAWIFAGDRFYATSWASPTGTSFVSPDGEQWSPVSDPSTVPQIYWGGWAMRRDGDAVVGWRPGQMASLRVALTHDNPDGLTCDDHRCFVLTGHDSDVTRFTLLVLVP